MRVGELLVMNGLITEEQLGQALKEQAHTAKKIGEILIEHGFINERQLVEVLEFQLGIPAVNLTDAPYDLEAVRLIDESVARKYGLIPIECKNKKLKVAMADPLNEGAIQEIQIQTGMIVQPFLATRTEVEEGIIRQYGLTESVQVLTEILGSAMEQQAVRIHLDPQEHGLVVKYRIGTELKEQRTIPSIMRVALINRIKHQAGLDPAERRLPQEGHMEIKIRGVAVEYRVSTIPTVNGESVVIRVMDPSAKRLKMTELAFREDHAQQFERELRRPGGGLVLISGPCGSGKTTTLYAALHHLIGEDQRILTVEDPMERRILGTTQVEVNERIGLTFASALRSVLQQDPNIIMIGDIRDAETAEMAVRAALSGRLVLGAVHGSHVLQTIDRLRGWGIDSYRLASSLSCIVSQRLVRRICHQCRQSIAATAEEIRLFETHGLLEDNDPKQPKGNFRTFLKAKIDGKITVTRGAGCRLCDQTGMQGFTAVHEVLEVDEPLHQLLLQNPPMSELERHLEKTGFKPMLYDGLWKAREGLTIAEDIVKAINGIGKST
ncbi:GspE/PulE family protein [Paenibacillus sedimenti]|uniref:Flp pilus assembly complex ATPase component TadA n=1 Tax=Paenibacillus sedimenti TaxID=2770274 RepID=A0A926KQT2_9BACL|nr:GspE/PulE family protein [Paenibacillus sedimenti]MBD0382367.1 Flp pilus assembly complex ATPase component TadA [Paenibacillus sedimenti]